MEPVFQFDLVLPARGHGSLTQALHQQLRAAILDGRLNAGTALPSTRATAAALEIARNTVVAAYDLLIAEGYAAAAPRRQAGRRGHRAAPSAEGAARGAESRRPAPQSGVADTAVTAVREGSARAQLSPGRSRASSFPARDLAAPVGARTA
jgi:GntR family transcriptional regulator/MocR family aminotransferase